MYDAWGNVTIQRDNSGCRLARFNPFLYRSYIYDYETGLYYLQSRYYDPEIGRFLNADEPTFIGLNNSITSYNVYAYCDGDPINNIDYFGQIALESYMAVAFVITFLTSMTAMQSLPKPEPITISNPFEGWSFSSEPLRSDNTVLGSADLVLPKVDTTAISISRAQVISFADTKIRDTVKPRGHFRYWTATVFPDYVDIGRPIIRSVAIEEVKKGRSVFTVTRAEAEDVVRSAANNRKPKGPENHGKENNTIGYYWHYHTHFHGTGHVFYLFEI